MVVCTVIALILIIKKNVESVRLILILVILKMSLMIIKWTWNFKNIKIEFTPI